MAWHTRRSNRSSFGGSRDHHYGALQHPDAWEGEPDPDPEAAGLHAQTRIRSSAKQAELAAARQAGASDSQIRALIESLTLLAGQLGSGERLDWSVRFEAKARSLCLRWRLLPAPGAPGAPDAEAPQPWQTRRFGGKASFQGSSQAKGNPAKRGFSPPPLPG